MEQSKHWSTVVLLTLLTVVMVACTEINQPATKLIVLRDLPKTMDSSYRQHLIVRSGYGGSITFVESNQLRVEMNITAPSLQDLSRVSYNYTDYHGILLLQLFDVPPIVESTLINYIGLLIGSVMVLTFVGSLVFVCWWQICKKAEIEEDKVPCPDSSQAPLLDGRPLPDANQVQQPQNNKLKKRCQAATQQVPTDESCISSEDDLNDDKSLPKRGIPARPGQRKDKAFEMEVIGQNLKTDTLTSIPGSDRHSQSSPGSLKKPELSGPERVALVSCIRMDSGSTDSHDGSCSKKGGQYIQLVGNDRRYAIDADEKTGSLRLRREGSGNSDNTIPDVVRTRSGTLRGHQNFTGGNDCSGCSQYVALTGTDGDFNDSEYSTINKALSGAKIVQTMNDNVQPKHDRPTVTFATTSPKKSDNLDTFGKPRVQDLSESRYATVSLGGARSKDGRRVKHVSHPLPVMDGPNLSRLSPSSSTDRSSDSGRLVDEAYGTLGSNDLSTISNSTTSTGSDSSGSVVTVIAADDSGGRRHLFPRQQGGDHKMIGMVQGGGTLPILKKDDRPTVRFNQPAIGPKYLQTSVICTMAVACLMSGVYAQMSTNTTVNIKIYVPPGFLLYKPEVFVRKGLFVNVTSLLKQDNMQVDTYEVDEPFVSDSSDKCRKMQCAQACDAVTGNCICRRGFKVVDDNRCEDINECHQEEPVCHKHALCINIEGKFACECKKGYYGNGQHCQACNLPCQNGTFEVMPCSDTHPKLCKECAKTCNIDGYFINGPCGPTHNTDCKLCRAKCGRLDYEYTPCIGSHDRQCKDVDSLVKPSVSKNIIYEDRRQVKQVLSYNLQQDTKTSTLTHVFPLNRGSGLTVRVSIIEASLAPMFRAVNHSESNDNEGFYQDIRITQEYCAYPIPEKYELSLNLHQGITTKAQYYSCNRSKRSTTSRCDGETGYYLHPREACETFNKYGRLPNLNTEGWSILCTKPGKLSDMFGISSELTDMTTMFVDKTLKCAEQRTNCDSCLTKCAHNMQKHVGSHRCNITADDSDNGESPRLQYCFSCCNKQECSKSCEVYHNRDCQQLRCITGNLAEFVLQPVYSHRSSVFACHIEPIPGYKIYDVEYAVLHEGKIVNNRTLKARRLYSKASGHPQRSVDTHTFLKIFFGSEITTLPDLIEGDSLTKLFSAGYYQAKQAELTSSDITSRTLFVRPKSPFSVSSKTWRKENCDTDIISQLVSATGNPPESDPFRPDPFLEVHYVSRGTYRLNNKTQSHLPFIYFEVPKDQSVLRAVYDPTAVRDDNTLKAELIHRDKEWSLHVNGELLKCPGAFNIVVRDGLNPTQTLFDYDVGVGCPNTFALDYTIPTEGLDDYDKTFLVDISDSYRTIKMKIFRPAPSMTKEDFEFFRSNKSYDTPVNYNVSREQTMTIFTPFIAVLCVVIFCMALVLFIGFVTETDKLGKKSDSDKVDSQHLFFVVCFVTFRATYSVAITFTILVLLIRHFNKESTNTLTQFPQYAETAGNSQRLDIEQIQLYVRDELQRQNSLANNTKHTCEQKLIQLQSQLEDVKQHMRVDNQEDRLVTQVALQYTKLMILNLTNNVNKFKQEFTAYAKKALDRLTRSIVQTSSAIQSSKWLAGAKVIYEAVKSKRSAQGLDTKPFMEWAGIEQEVDRLVADLSLKDFPLPNLTEFLNVEIPKTNTKQTPIPKASDVVLPRNQWYYQYEKKPPAFGADSSAEKPPKETKLNTNDIISLTSLLAILVAIDLVWFIHRMARTYSTAKMILYGCPVYIACKKLTGDSSHRAESGKSSRIVKCLRFVKDLNLRIMKTEFVPKLVATVTVCCTLYIVLAASDKLLTVKTLASLGYFDALVAPVETSYRLAITRVKMNAHRINKFEFPFYEELVNVRTKRYQLLLEMYAEVQRSNAILHDSEYCMWKKMLKPDEPCNCTTVQVGRLHFDGCELPPVLPQAYHRKDFGLHREQLSHAIVPYVNAAREIIMDTGHLVAIFVAILVLVDILGAVVWIYLKRFNLLRLKPLFEIEQLPIPEAKRT